MLNMFFVGQESGCGLAEASDSGSLTRLQSGCQLGLQLSQGWLGNMGPKLPCVAVAALRSSVAIARRQQCLGFLPRSLSMGQLTIWYLDFPKVMTPGETVQERANKIEGIVFSKPNLESDCSSLCHILFARRHYSKGRTCQQGAYQEAGSLRAILDTAYPKHPNQTFRDENDNVCDE